MEAQVEPGRLYYAIVTPRMGVWKARFSLRPVHGSERSELSEWDRGTSWTELDETSMRWAGENVADADAKRAKYFPEWVQKGAVGRPVLLPEDGQ